MDTINSPIYATSPATNVSTHYGFIPTYKILDTLNEHGWKVRQALFANSRAENRIGKQKHLVRLMHDDYKMEGRAIELVFINSHDRSTAGRFFAGVLESACINGLIVGESLSNIKVYHIGENANSTIIEGVYEIIDRVPQIVEHIDLLKELHLTDDEIYQYNTDALNIRWKNRSPINPQELSLYRRDEDNSNSLWKVLNRVQEHLIMGGNSGRSSNGRNLVTRSIKNISENIRINRELWDMTTYWARTKSYSF